MMNRFTVTYVDPGLLSDGEKNEPVALTLPPEEADIDKV
jgi:hypothetical protein